MIFFHIFINISWRKVRILFPCLTRFAIIISLTIFFFLNTVNEKRVRKEKKMFCTCNIITAQFQLSMHYVSLKKEHKYINNCCGKLKMEKEMKKKINKTLRNVYRNEKKPRNREEKIGNCLIEFYTVVVISVVAFFASMITYANAWMFTSRNRLMAITGLLALAFLMSVDLVTILISNFNATLDTNSLKMKVKWRPSS